jgi:class 3 adenylate cyclase
LWESAPEAMRAALERHDALLRTAINAHGGHVFSTGGDGLAAVFARSADAMAAASQAQAALTAEEWPQDAPVRARMAVHTGEAIERDGDYFGPALNRAARFRMKARACSSSTPTFVLLRCQPAAMRSSIDLRS